MPGEEAWLVVEWRDTGERSYYLIGHPPRTTLRTLAATIEAWWHSPLVEALVRLLVARQGCGPEEFGFDHFEGRTWRGQYHNALMTMSRLAFLTEPQAP